MPIYDYQCRGCGEKFELLVLKGTVPACPACEKQDLEQLISDFAVSSSELRMARVKKAQQAHRSSRDVVDKNVADAEYTDHHRKEELGLA